MRSKLIIQNFITHLFEDLIEAIIIHMTTKKTQTKQNKREAKALEKAKAKKNKELKSTSKGTSDIQLFENFVK